MECKGYVSSVTYNHVYTPEITNKLRAIDEILNLVQEWKNEWEENWKWDLALEKYGGEYFKKVVEIIEANDLSL